MIRVFPKSRRVAYGAGIPLALVAFAVSYLVLGHFVDGVPSRVLSAALIAVVAFSLVLMAARVIAASEYQRLLLPLYENLDPEAMLTAIWQIQEDKLSAGERIMFSVHKANGLLYLGRFDEAEAVLSSVTPDERDLNNRYLVEGGLASIHLLSGDAKGVRESMKRLSAITGAQKCSKELSLRTRRVIGYLQLCLAIRMGSNVDIEPLMKDFESTRVPTHKLDAAYYLVLYSRRHKDVKADEYIAYIREKGSKTVYPSLIADV